jgi:signal transduction histidine kinase
VKSLDAPLRELQHELRTPVGNILGCAQLIALAHDLDQAQAWSRHIETAAAHLLNLVDALVQAQASGACDEPLLAAELAASAELRGVVCSVTQMLMATAQTAEVTLETQVLFDGSLQAVGGAAVHRQVLLNLVGNAIKYTPRGGRVQLRASPSGDGTHRARISVVDNGLGMSAAQQQRLFRPGERLGREASGIAGSGHGLYLTQRLVQRLGGELQVRSQPGTGTTVELHLPLCGASAAAPRP